jgi:hypothetical protein
MFNKFLWLIGGLLLTLSSVAFALSPLEPFQDASSFAPWYQPAVSALQTKGIIKGYEDYTFRPDNQVTRAEMAVMMNRMYDVITSDHYGTMRSHRYVTSDQLYDVLENISSLDLELGDYNSMILMARAGINPTPGSVVRHLSPAFSLEGEYKYDEEIYKAYLHEAGGGEGFYIHIGHDEDRWFGPFDEDTSYEPFPCDEC